MGNTRELGKNMGEIVREEKLGKLEATVAPLTEEGWWKQPPIMRMGGVATLPQPHPVF